jgi:hypothetical protein
VEEKGKQSIELARQECEEFRPVVGLGAVLRLSAQDIGAAQQVWSRQSMGWSSRTSIWIPSFAGPTAINDGNANCGPSPWSLSPYVEATAKALRELARRVACIELVSYHSSSFGGHKLLQVLPSTLQAGRYVRDLLLPRAQKDELSIIVTRQGETWGLPAQEGVSSIVYYTGQQAHGVHFGPNTTGGREILRQIRETGPLS